MFRTGHKRCQSKNSSASLNRKIQNTFKLKKRRKKVVFFESIHFDLKTQEWEDPELAWDTSVYMFDDVILPVDKIWTPELLVTNA